MEAALITKLLATSSITTLTGQRITWGRRDQSSALPSLVLHRIDGLRDYHMAGPSGLISSRVQADCWGLSYGAAKGLARALEAAVSGASFIQSAIRFDLIMVVDERDDDFDEDGKALFRTSLDLSVLHAAAS